LRYVSYKKSKKEAHKLTYEQWNTSQKWLDGQYDDYMKGLDGAE